MQARILVGMFCLVLGAGEALRAEVPAIRGVWLNRHIMKGGTDAIRNFCLKAKQAGINTIYANFWFHGCVIYPGSKFARQHADFTGKDPLKDLLDAASPLMIQVQAWGEYGFFTHYNYTDDQQDVGYILKDHPDWIARDRNGKVSLKNSTQGFSHYSMNPAHPGAQQFLIDISLEVLEKYPGLSGLHQDRIRYLAHNFSYDPYTRQLCQEALGFDPRDVSEDNDRWVSFRERVVTDFARRLGAVVHEKFPGKLFTASVVPPYMIHEKYQNWSQWLRVKRSRRRRAPSESRPVDYVVPMLYGGAAWLAGALREVTRILPSGSPLVAGIDVMSGNEAEIARQLHVVDDRGGEGVVLWGDATVRDHPDYFWPGMEAYAPRPWCRGW